MSFRGEPDADWPESLDAQRGSPNRSTLARPVVLQVDYGMVSHGLAPLFVDGHATELGVWGFSSDVLRRLRRLNELYDRQINLDDPTDPTWQMADRDRNEFNALLPFVAAELQIALGDNWRLIVDSKPL